MGKGEIFYFSIFTGVFPGKKKQPNAPFLSDAPSPFAERQELPGVASCNAGEFSLTA
jgi:hypothetical protein